jgi:hypothetical protein
LLSRSRHKYYKFPSPQTDHQDYWQKILHRKSSACCSLPSLNNLFVLQWHPPRHGHGSRALGLGQRSHGTQGLRVRAKDLWEAGF